MKCVLYDWLKIQPIGQIDVEKIALELSQLSHPHAMRIQVLIIHHSLKYNCQEAIPYNGMMLTTDNGVRYGDINDLPYSLLKILAAYIEMARKQSA